MFRIIPFLALVLSVTACALGDEIYDYDGDGSPDSIDCQPDNAAIFPGNADEFGDDVDSDCDGADGVDRDGDGYPANLEEGDPQRDCDDNNSLVHPGAEDVADDGLDNDCDGQEQVDADGDGNFDGLTDCDDTDPTVYQGATEVADGKDNDCDGRIDDGTEGADDDNDGNCEGFVAEGGTALSCSDGSLPGDCDDTDPLLNAADEDGDGSTTCAGDCDDTDASRAPGQPELCNAADDNCDQVLAEEEQDQDADGQTACGGDCDDLDGTVYVGAEESCDTTDSDCDDSIVDSFVDTDGDLSPDCVDADDDGDGTPDTEDCDSDNAAVYPGAPESCDGVDSDCNGSLVDTFDDTDSDLDPDCTDADDDGDGEADGDDCDPLDATIYTGATESCDSVDSDCDASLVDDFDDYDGDLNPDCVDPDDDNDGSVDEVDCEPTNAAIYPGNSEWCDSTDSDCDLSLVDEFEDRDGDGDPDCTDPDDDGDGDPDTSDCEDLDASIYTGATESCDSVDSDCDGSLVDDFDDYDGDANPDCEDLDDDNDSDPDTSDCAPLNALIYTGATEACDGEDTDCTDGPASNEADDDEDGYMPCAGDCNDNNASVFSGGPEICNGLDDDCDGYTPSAETDFDGDGYVTCTPWTGTDSSIVSGGDCSDSSDAVYPGATELCNRFIDNCGGSLPADEIDGDSDGFTPCEGDCDDGEGAVYPGNGVWEDPNDGYDSNCDGVDWVSLSEADVEILSDRALSYFGWTACGGGDFDGNGVSDVVVGAPYHSESGVQSGRAFVYSGTDIADPSASPVETGQAAAILVGESSWNSAGEQVSWAGDVDGDGTDDLLTSAHWFDVATTAGINHGRAYLTFGSTLSSWTAEAEMGQADVTFNGPNDNAQLGKALGSAGDVDGDGRADVLFSAPYFGDSHINEGAVYVFFGSTLVGEVEYGPATLEAEDGDVRIMGATNFLQIGDSVASIGNVDGDTYADLVIGVVHQDDPSRSLDNSGAVYVFLGDQLKTGATAEVQLAGVTILGNQDEGWFGSQVASAGDFDGDGRDDLLIGARFEDRDYPSSADDNAGRAYLFKASTLVTSSSFDADDADVVIVGADDEDWLGRGLDGVGDFDGDGFDDVLVAAPGASGGEGEAAGMLYLFSGGSIKGGGQFTASSGAAVAFSGEAAVDRAGLNVCGAGDLDGDGADDLIISAPTNDGGYPEGGKAYLLISPW